jgi:glycosyltransferase involved in cell wall biosynthesis
LGVLGTQDGVDGLLRGFRALIDRGRDDVTLRIAGDGPEGPRLRALADQLGLADRVQFAGWLDKARLDACVDDFDGLVVPDPVNAFNDTCPMLKLSHALARGMPVILTPLQENLEITGGDGFVAAGSGATELADAIDRWLGSSQSERAEMGQRLRGRYDSVLAWEPHRERYLEVLAQLHAGTSRPASSA